jgi:hypothetical protein
VIHVAAELYLWEDTGALPSNPALLLLKQLQEKNFIKVSFIYKQGNGNYL